MAMEPPSSLNRELFRFARIKSPRVLLLTERLSNFPQGKSLLSKKGKARLAAAEKIRSAKTYIDGSKKLAFDYLAPLKIKTLPENKMPSRDDIRDLDEFSRQLETNRENIKEDLKRLALSLYSAIILKDAKDTEHLSRWLQFVESYTDLPGIPERRFYAPVVTRRFQPPTKASPEKGEKKEEQDELLPEAEDGKSSPRLKPCQVLILWDAVTQYRKVLIENLDRQMDQVIRRKFSGKMVKQKQKMTKEKAQSTRPAPDPAAYKAFTRGKRQELDALRQRKQEKRAAAPIALVSDMLRDKDFISKTRDLKHLLEKIDLSREDLEEQVKEQEDLESWYDVAKRKAPTLRGDSKCHAGIDNPCMEEIAKHRPLISGQDGVRPLGEADLVVVEENWMKYTPGEISSIETVMKNKRWEKVVTSEKSLETLTETRTESITEKESESQTTSQNELSSQVKSEIKTRMETDLTSSVRGSGGGSIGVVDFSGEGAIVAGVGFGLDTSIGTAEGSNFSSEIITRALEKTKQTVTERQTEKTFSRFETSYTHEVDNTGTSSAHINAVYCYLNKHICITERQYGLRQFLLADLVFPGNDLLKKEMQRRMLSMYDLGMPPVFDIGPADIHEHNYLELVGRYRASNVKPPPPLIKHIGRTYKTDTTNETQFKEDSKIRKVAEVLVPFFGQYKRFLIQDNIEVPEGYRVQWVKVTVSHGSNGVSIPAHLPFSLAGALIYALPKIMISAIPIYTLFYLPIALTEIVYLASPVLHYNADSSNCTITIGHQSQEAPYFFFQPDDLLNRIANLAAGFPQLSDGVMSQIRETIETFLLDMPDAIETQLVDGLQGTFNGAVEKLKDLVAVIKLMAKPVTDGPTSLTDSDVEEITDFFSSGYTELTDALKAANINVDSLIQPLNDLITDIFDVIEGDLLQGFLDELANLFAVFENNDYREFHSFKDRGDRLPVSFNCIALKPGLTINLTAVLVRLEDQALDAWRMETFDRLHQAYYQMEADYETKQMQQDRTVRRDSPGLMRQEELRVIKDRVIRALDGLHPPAAPGPMSLSRYKLFEQAIDWDNISFRLYLYGPNGRELVFEKLGLFQRGDERRKHFMNALWAQVLIPLKDTNAMLESYLMGYLQSGEVKTLDELIDPASEPDGEIDEVAAIYRDVILRRQLLREEPVETHRPEVVPTDLMIIFEDSEDLELPENADALSRCYGSETS